jgi:hypothetical protein
MVVSKCDVGWDPRVRDLVRRTSQHDVAHLGLRELGERLLVGSKNIVVYDDVI